MLEARNLHQPDIDDRHETAVSDGEQVTKALRVVKRVAAGDFEARILGISAEGELGELFHTVNELIDRCDAYVRESGACMDHVSHNEYFRSIIETGMQGVFLNASRTVNDALHSMQRRVENFSKIANVFETDVFGIVGNVSNAATELQASSAALRYHGQ